MSWLAPSLSKSLRIDDGDGEVNDDDVVRPHNDADVPSTTSTKPQNENENEIESDEDEAQTRGVKQDLSELQQTLTCQFWGVASFLAPPPLPHNRIATPDCSRSEPADHRPGQPPMGFNEEEEEEELEEDEYVVGITEEVLAFARNIAMHPETWLDFPLDEEEDLGDFEMSNAQHEHAMMVEHLAPRLAALRIELCPCHMSESYFWKVYFVLLHSRLNKQDAEILSTDQVMDARAKWMQELHCLTPTSVAKMSEHEWFGRSTSRLKDSPNTIHDDFEDYSSASSRSAHYEDTSHRTYPFESSMSSTVYETEKHPVESNDMPFIDKSVIEEKPFIKTEEKNVTVGPSSAIYSYEDDDDDDDWPEEDIELGGCCRTAISDLNEEDISFSDLEDDDFQAPTKLKVVQKDLEASRTDVNDHPQALIIG